MTIELNWANEENAQRPNNFNHPDYEILLVKISDVIPLMHSSMRLDLNHDKGGENGIKERLPRAREHFLSGEPMDLPEISCNDRNNVVDFTNGRHRMVAAYQLGAEFIPMFVYKPNIDKFKSLIETKPFEDKNILNFLKNKEKNNKPNKSNKRTI